MLTALGLLAIGGVIVFWVYSTNKETFARPIKKITDIADVNNDGKVNLEDVKTVATTVVAEANVVVAETKQVVESAKIKAKKTVAKVKKTAGRKKKNS